MKKILLTLAALLSTTAFVSASLTDPNEEASSISIEVPGPGAEIPNSSHHHKKKKMTKEQAEESIKKHLEGAKKAAESITGADHKVLAENLINQIQGNLDTVAKLDEKNHHFYHLAHASEWKHNKVKELAKEDKHHDAAAKKKAEHEAKKEAKKGAHHDKKAEVKADDKAKDGDKKDGDMKHDDAKKDDMKHDDKAKDGDKKDGDMKHDDAKKDDMKHDDKAKDGDKKEEEKK